MEDLSYIKLSRKIMYWEWYRDINTCRLFIHMLLKANWKDGKFKGIDIPRGSFVSSIQKLSEETDLTVRKIRTAISHLESTGEVTSKSYSKFTVFTINNYCEYQVTDKQPTNNRQTDDKQPTTIEKKKEGKKGKNSNSNQFNQFQQNSYDFGALENDILSN